MFQTLSCIYMPLGTWAEVKVHSYHALTSVCVGQLYMLRTSHAPVQATVGVGTSLIWAFCVAITRGGWGITMMLSLYYCIIIFQTWRPCEALLSSLLLHLFESLFEKGEMKVFRLFESPGLKEG